MADRVTVRTTADFSADLAVLTAGGGSQAEAIRRAVALLADAHRYAYDYGHARLPQVTGFLMGTTAISTAPGLPERFEVEVPAVGD